MARAYVPGPWRKADTPTPDDPGVLIDPVCGMAASDMVATESVLRNGGFAAFTGCVPGQLIRWEQESGWTRRGYGQVAERETPLTCRKSGTRSRPSSTLP